MFLQRLIGIYCLLVTISCDGLAPCNQRWLTDRLFSTNHHALWYVVISKYCPTENMNKEQKEELLLLAKKLALQKRERGQGHRKNGEDPSIELRKSVYTNVAVELEKQEDQARSAYERDRQWWWSSFDPCSIDKADGLITNQIEKQFFAALPQAINEVVTQVAREIVEPLLTVSDKQYYSMAAAQGILASLQEEFKAHGGRLDVYVNFFEISVHERVREYLKTNFPNQAQHLGLFAQSSQLDSLHVSLARSSESIVDIWPDIEDEKRNKAFYSDENKKKLLARRDEQSECPQCSNDFVEQGSRVNTSCGHFVCAWCYYQWVYVANNNTCPQCNGPVIRKDFAETILKKYMKKPE